MSIRLEAMDALKVFKSCLLLVGLFGLLFISEYYRSSIRYRYHSANPADHISCNHFSFNKKDYEIFDDSFLFEMMLMNTKRNYIPSPNHHEKTYIHSVTPKTWNKIDKNSMKQTEEDMKLTSEESSSFTMPKEQFNVPSPNQASGTTSGEQKVPRLPIWLFAQLPSINTSGMFAKTSRNERDSDALDDSVENILNEKLIHSKYSKINLSVMGKSLSRIKNKVLHEEKMNRQRIVSFFGDGSSTSKRIKEIVSEKIEVLRLALIPVFKAHKNIVDSIRKDIVRSIDTTMHIIIKFIDMINNISIKPLTHGLNKLVAP